MMITTLSFAGGDIVPAPVVQEKQDYWYLGAGIVYNRVYSTDSGWFDDSPLTQDELGGLTGIIGYEYNQYLAIEGRISKTFWKRDYADLTTYSIFLKPQYQFRDNEESGTTNNSFFSIYGLLGFGNAKVEGSSGDSGHIGAHPNVVGREIMNETGFQWGVGMSYTFVTEANEQHTRYRDSWSIFVDYTMTANDGSIHSTLYSYDPKVYNKLSTDGLTVGVLYKF